MAELEKWRFCDNCNSDCGRHLSGAMCYDCGAPIFICSACKVRTRTHLTDCPREQNMFRAMYRAVLGRVERLEKSIGAVESHDACTVQVPPARLQSDRRERDVLRNVQQERDQLRTETKRLRGALRDLGERAKSEADNAGRV